MFVLYVFNTIGTINLDYAKQVAISQHASDYDAMKWRLEATAKNAIHRLLTIKKISFTEAIQAYANNLAIDEKLDAKVMKKIVMEDTTDNIKIMYDTFDYINEALNNETNSLFNKAGNPNISPAELETIHTMIKYARINITDFISLKSIAKSNASNFTIESIVVKLNLIMLKYLHTGNMATKSCEYDHKLRPKKPQAPKIKVVPTKRPKSPKKPSKDANKNIKHEKIDSSLCYYYNFKSCFRKNCNKSHLCAIDGCRQGHPASQHKA